MESIIKIVKCLLLSVVLFASFLCNAQKTTEQPGNPACGWLEIHLSGKNSELSVVSPGNAYNWKKANWGTPGPRYFGVYPRSEEWTKGEVSVLSKTGGKLDLRFSAEPPVNRSRAPEHRRDVFYRQVMFDGKDVLQGKTVRASIWSICSVVVDLPANREIKIVFHYKTATKRPRHKLK